MIVFLLASSGSVLLLGCFLWRKFLAPQPFGWANAITLFRNVLTATIINILVFDYGANEGVLIALLSVFALLLDGVDGYIARKLGQCSDFGARFDMESDAFFILVLSIGVVTVYGAAAWVILIGAMRYLYVAGQYVYKPLNLPVKDRYSRKVFCVIQIIALVLPYTHILPKTIWEPMLLMSLATLTFSFGRDIFEQVQSAKEVRANETV